MNKSPELKNYINVHQFLEDFYRFRKQTDDSFSYDIWAQEIGIKNRSYLRLIVIGKRAVSEETVNLLCRYFKFQDKQEEYFRMLVGYSKSKSHEQKKLYGKKLTALMRNDLQQHEIENHFDFLSKPSFPRLQTLLSFDDIEKTPENLARLLKISIQELSQGLGILKNLGLAEEINGQWIATKKSFKIPDRVGDVALEMFHNESLKEAIAAQQSSKETRRYRSLLMAMNKNEFDTFLKNLQDFVQSELSQFNFSELEDRELYQVNFNLFPVTKNKEL